jgi:hypothetical protein
MIKLVTTITEHASGIDTITKMQFESGVKPNGTKREITHAVNLMKNLELWSKTVSENVQPSPEQ